MVHQVFVLDEQLGALGALVAVLVRRERLVVPRHEVLGEDPGQVRLGEGHVSRLGQRGRHGLELFPGGGGRQAGLLERLGVHVHDRSGRVERHADHLAIGIGVEVPHALDVVVGAERHRAVLRQEVGGGDGRALGADHGGGAGVEHLHDVRLLARAEGGDGGRQRFLVAAPEDRDDPVVRLAGVEHFGEFVGRVTQRTAHAMPEGDLGLREGRCRQ
jgi:hypothetical protein